MVESGVVPGATQDMVQSILEQELGLKTGRDFWLALSYERVMPGKLLEYLSDMPRVANGVDEESTRGVVALYRSVHPVRAVTVSCCCASCCGVSRGKTRAPSLKAGFESEIFAFS